MNEAAFEGAYEANLVDQLRGSEYALISLVAEFEGRIVGHILFSRMWINICSDVELRSLAGLSELR